MSRERPMQIKTAESFPPFVKILRSPSGGTGEELRIAMGRVWKPTWYQLNPYADHFGFRIWDWKDSKTNARRYRFVTDAVYIDLAARSDKPINAIDYKDLRNAVAERRAAIAKETETASRKGRGKGKTNGTETETETAPRPRKGRGKGRANGTETANAA